MKNWQKSVVGFFTGSQAGFIMLGCLAGAAIGGIYGIYSRVSAPPLSVGLWTAGIKDQSGTPLAHGPITPMLPVSPSLSNDQSENLKVGLALLEGGNLFKEGHFKEAIPKLDQYIRRFPNDKEMAGIYIMRGEAKCAIGDWAGCISDFDSATRLDPQNGSVVDNATAKYWVLLQMLFLLPNAEARMKGDNPTAAHWAKAGNDIRLLDQLAVDPDAIEAGRLVAAICDRTSGADETSENGDSLLRLIAGALRGNVMETAGKQIDEFADLAEANRTDLCQVSALEGSSRRRHPNAVFWGLFDAIAQGRAFRPG